MSTNPSAASSRLTPRSLLLPLLVVLVLAAVGLTWAKWMPYAQRTAGLLGGAPWDGSPLTDKALEADTWWEGGWALTVAYTKAVWKALVVAIVLSAAIQAFLGPRGLRRLLGGAHGGELRAGVAGLPTMMCSCCTAPVAVGMRRGGLPVSTAVTFWLANPVLNPAVVVFLLIIGPWEWGTVRVVVGIALIVVVAVAARRLAPAMADTEGLASVEGADGAIEAPRMHPLARFVRELGRLTLTLVPEYLLLVFAVGAVTAATGFSLAEVSWGAGALLVFTVACVLFVIPTGGEIPVLLALAAGGASPWALGIALMCLSAVSLPSLVMVMRALTWRVCAVAAACVLVAGLAAGALLAL